LFQLFQKLVQDVYETKDQIFLHQPIFKKNESKYVQETIKSTMVSSVGAYVDEFEKLLRNYSGAPGAVAVVNGTAALHLSLHIAEVSSQDLVLTQSLSFIATCNAISYCGAEPVFIDVDLETMSLSPSALEIWLNENAYIDNEGNCLANKNNKRIRACVPMHTFGHSANIFEIKKLCDNWNIILIEDAAEAMGSFNQKKHLGTIGQMGVLSFNGNKIITTGGGGAILSNKKISKKAKHLSTTAKIDHLYEFNYDHIGFNYRMPNINAALGCAQVELLETFVMHKRKLAKLYKSFFDSQGVSFFIEPKKCRSNYWLNTIFLESKKNRDDFLIASNHSKIMTRPIWKLIHTLPMYKHCQCGSLKNSIWLQDRAVNIPSGVPSSW
jgi:aminotransferase in exopolysaccharide biosynthesis